MKSILKRRPAVMNMGFHYTRQFSRRTRVKVVGLVDQSTDDWSIWYENMHKPAALKRMAEAGYDMIEIHFIYGFGFDGEKKEIELTKTMVENAHDAGLKVIGYFQFFSVQSELFFIENPWAEDSLQYDANGKPHLYSYDRPALCLSNPKTLEYYLQGIELGLGCCKLDGIRFDNDYYRGCYCQTCLNDFRNYLKNKFPAEKAKKVFGIEKFDKIIFPPAENTRDPLWIAMVNYRIEKRSSFMKKLKEKILSLNPDAILGGNPALSKKLPEVSRVHVYVPELGNTHDIVCAENSLFPACTSQTIRHQATLYKHGQANNFKIYPSHHLHVGESIRWPENKNECALSLCEALAFGGHVACTTWGIRMEELPDLCLYERKEYLDALIPIAKFIKENSSIYEDAQCNAEIGIYINKASSICDYDNLFRSIQGLIQILLRKKIPFKFVDNDQEKILKRIRVLIIPDVSLVSQKQFEMLKNFADSKKIIMTGSSCTYDDYYLQRKTEDVNSLRNHSNTIYLPDCPEKLLPEQIGRAGANFSRYDYPENAAVLLDSLYLVWNPDFSIKASDFIAVDYFDTEKNKILHLINYDNSNPSDIKIVFDGTKDDISIFWPKNFGPSKAPVIHQESDKTIIEIEKLSTYIVIQKNR